MNNTDTDFSLSGEELWLRRARRFLTKPEILREILTAGIAMLSQQLCGINLPPDQFIHHLSFTPPTGLN